MVDFDVAVAQWAEKAKGKLNQFAAEFCQDISDEVITKTPVDTGYLRASWWASINAPGSGTVAGPKPQGGVSQAAIVAGTMKAGEVYYLMNGAAYARRIEYGFVGEDSLGRVYNQQPRAMVRNAVARAPVIAEAVIARLK